MECFICKLRENKGVFQCDGCREHICKKCGGLTASEVKVLELSTGRVMKFHCPRCREGASYRLLWDLIRSKETIIEDKEEIITLLKQEIDHLKFGSKVGEVEASYSQVVKGGREEVLLVRPKIKPKNETHSSQNTKQRLQENINPTELGVGVTRVRYSREGGVVIGCKSQKDVASISKEVERKLGQEYDVKIPEKKTQRLEYIILMRKL